MEEQTMTAGELFDIANTPENEIPVQLREYIKKLREDLLSTKIEISGTAQAMGVTEDQAKKVFAIMINLRALKQSKAAPKTAPKAEPPVKTEEPAVESTDEVDW